MSKKFDDFRFEGFNRSDLSNKYQTMKRISEDENKIIVNVGPSHLEETKYGYALVLDSEYVVFIKNWQVECNYYGNEVILDRKYFIPKKWGSHPEFFDIIEENHDFNTWLEAAQDQDEAGTIVHWSK